MRSAFALWVPCIALAALVLGSCSAAAPPLDAGVPQPPESPCELDAESLQKIEQLDAAFESEHRAQETNQQHDEGYGYEFEDDPLGATVEDGSCDCLARAIPSDASPSCVSQLRAALHCLGGPGSVRLWSHRNCLPYRATTAVANTTIEFVQSGCVVPQSVYLLVKVERKAPATSR